MPAVNLEPVLHSASPPSSSFLCGVPTQVPKLDLNSLESRQAFNLQSKVANSSEPGSRENLHWDMYSVCLQSQKIQNAIPPQQSSYSRKLIRDKSDGTASEGGRRTGNGHKRGCVFYGVTKWLKPIQAEDCLKMQIYHTSNNHTLKNCYF